MNRISEENKRLIEARLEAADFLTEEEKECLFTKNAAAILPRLAEILQIGADGKSVSYADSPLTGKQRRSRALRAAVAKLYGIAFRL